MRNTAVFSGLPPSIVDSLLNAVESMGCDAGTSTQTVIEQRNDYRAMLRDNGMLHSIDKNINVSETALCAVGGTYCCRPVLASTLVSIVSFTVPGLHGGKTERSIASNMFTAIESEASISGLARGLGARMIAEEAVGSANSYDFVLIDGSSPVLFGHYLENLPAALASRGTKTSQVFLNDIRGAMSAFETLATDTSFAGIIYDPRHNPTTEFPGVPGDETALSGDALLTFIIDPGEYIGPVTINGQILEKARRLPIKDKAFAGIRDGIVDALSELRTLYIRPEEWTPAFRVETSIGPDNTTIAEICAAIASQCNSTGIDMPHPVKTAARLSGHFAEAVSSIESAVLSKAQTCIQHTGTIPPAIFNTDI